MKEKIKENMQLIFVVLMFVATIALIVAIFAVVKYGKALEAHPIKYGIEKLELDYCQCWVGQQMYTAYNEEKKYNGSIITLLNNTGDTSWDKVKS